MAPVEFLKVLRRRWRVLLACFLLAGAAGYILSPEQPAEPNGPGFQAAVTVVPAPDAAKAPNLYLAAHLATTPDVASLAAQQLPPGVGPSDEMAITATVNPDVGALTIVATDLDRNRATLLAQAYAAGTIQFVGTATAGSQEEALAAAQKELKGVEKSIKSLEDDMAGRRTDAVLQAKLDTEMARYGIVFQRVQDLLVADQSPEPLQVIGTPEVTPLDEGVIKAPDDRRARALLAGVLGLVLGLGVALAVDRLDPRLRGRDEVEGTFGLPVLGEVPRISRRARANHALVTAVRPFSTAAEAYRSLRSAITLVGQTRRADSGAAPAPPSVRPATQVLVIAGAHGREGKSTTVVNLAAALAETGQSVLVIDCDFRKPEAHLYLDASPGRALTDVTETGVGQLDQIIRSTAVPRVELVTSGGPVSQPVSMLPRLAGIIADARLRADVVLIDTSPLLLASEAVDVLPHADAVLVTCRLGRTTFEQARRTREVLQRAEVPLLGVVVTGTAPNRGTPYGQPSRGQALRSLLTGWLHPAGHDRGRHVSQRSEPMTDATANVEREQAAGVAVPELPDDARPDQPEVQRPAELPDRRPDEQLSQQRDEWPARRPYQRRHEHPDQRPPEHPDELADQQPDQLQETDQGESPDQPPDPRHDHPHEAPPDQPPEHFHEAAPQQPPDQRHDHPHEEAPDEAADQGQETRQEEAAWSGG